MVVGVLRITLLLHDNHSLKEKRRVLKSLLKKTGDRFNVATAEVGSHDLWQRAEIAVAAVGTDAAFVNSVLDKVLNYIEGLYAGEIADFNVELISM